jgi:Transposase
VLKQHEAGRKVPELAREIGVGEATIYTWKSKYGGMDVSDAQKLKSLEDENRCLKHPGGRPQPGQGSFEGGDPRKRLELAGMRNDVAFASAQFRMPMASRLVRPNQEWALDFVSDSLATGRGIRVLAIVDSFTRKKLS